MGVLLNQMLKYDAADLDEHQVVAMFHTLTTTLPVVIFTVLPRSFRKDAATLARRGLITLPEGFPHV